MINAEGNGVVEYVDADKISIKYDMTEDERLVTFDGDTKTYELIKFRKTNQGTCINLKPIVKKGDRVTKGQVLSEGYATQKWRVSSWKKYESSIYALERL